MVFFCILGEPKSISFRNNPWYILGIIRIPFGVPCLGAGLLRLRWLGLNIKYQIPTGLAQSTPLPKNLGFNIKY